MGATGAARKLASAAALGGGGLSVLGAGLYGVLVAEAKFARKVIGTISDGPPLDATGWYGRGRPGPAIRIALGERDKGCAMCSRPLPWCDAHHIEFWSRDGRTSARNMVMLCGGCHHRVHDCGWIIHVDDHDNVSFIPPASVDPYRRRQSSSSARSAA